jgi:hypothetical protein
VSLALTVVDKLRGADPIEIGGLMQRDVVGQQHHLEARSSAGYRPRQRDLPRCVACADWMVAPEASALRADGNVSYLWSCDCCGQSFVTKAAAAEVA